MKFTSPRTLYEFICHSASDPSVWCGLSLTVVWFPIVSFQHYFLEGSSLRFQKFLKHKVHRASPKAV